MDTITLIEDLANRGRPLQAVDKRNLQAYIEEVERLYIKPALGNALYMSLSKRQDFDERHTTLLEGGEYTKGEHTLYFSGLYVVVAYYVYAQNVMCGDFQATRYGMVVKDGDYSQRLSTKERSEAYNNALEVAHAHLSDCLQYCKTVGLIKTGSTRVTGAGSVRIRKIG